VDALAVVRPQRAHRDPVGDAFAHSRYQRLGSASAAVNNAGWYRPGGLAMPDDVTQRHEPPPPPGPVTSLHDPRAIQILSTEHWGLLSARSLAYNEAFTRGGMFLGFLSMSFVALALVAGAMSAGSEFLLVAALVIGFDLVIGLTTYGRIVAANYEDYLAVHGMARIRHGYGEIAPVVLPYFTTGTHDDQRGVLIGYPTAPARGVGSLLYGLTTSAGMIGLIVAMLGGVLAFIVGLLAGVPVEGSFVVAAAAALVTFAILLAYAYRYFARRQGALEARFPTPAEDEA
jgi:hypothetical protein